MDSKDNELARQQQERRKRVSRIKTGIIMTSNMDSNIYTCHSCTGHHGCQTEFENIQA